MQDEVSLPPYIEANADRDFIKGDDSMYRAIPLNKHRMPIFEYKYVKWFKSSKEMQYIEKYMKEHMFSFELMAVKLKAFVYAPELPPLK